MRVIVILLAIVGLAWVSIRVLLPIGEAAVFAIGITIVQVLGSVDPKKAGVKKLKVVKFLVVYPFKEFWSRLAGCEHYVVEVAVGNWIYKPPFRIKRGVR